MPSTNLEVAQSIKQQLDFYVLTLNFTILGFSLQTAKFGSSVVADSVELAAWLLLVVSGFACIKKLAAISAIHFAAATLPSPTTPDAKSAIETFSKKTVEWFHKLHVYSFYFGIFSLVIARAWLPVQGIIERLHSGK